MCPTFPAVLWTVITLSLLATTWEIEWMKDGLHLNSDQFNMWRLSASLQDTALNCQGVEVLLDIM